MQSKADNEEIKIRSINYLFIYVAVVVFVSEFATKKVPNNDERKRGNFRLLFCEKVEVLHSVFRI